MRVHVGDGLFCFEGVGSRCVCVGMEGSVHPVCVCKGGVKSIMYFISIFTGPKWKGTQLLGFHSGDTPVRQKAGQLFL